MLERKVLTKTIYRHTNTRKKIAKVQQKMFYVLKKEKEEQKVTKKWTKKKKRKKEKEKKKRRKNGKKLKIKKGNRKKEKLIPDQFRWVGGWVGEWMSRWMLKPFKGLPTAIKNWKVFQTSYEVFARPNVNISKRWISQTHLQSTSSSYPLRHNFTTKKAFHKYGVDHKMLLRPTFSLYEIAH